MIKKVILDTDLGSDVDDVGALALANIFHNEGKINLIGVTHTTSGKYGPLVCEAVNEAYGNGDIPLGVYKGKSFLEEELPNNYPEITSASFHHKHNDVSEIEDSIRVLRKLLSNNKEVTLIFIGQLLNLYNLMKSESDDISSLSGMELINNSVKEVYIMGGKFPSITGIPDPNPEGEYNLGTAIDEAMYVFSNLKKKIVLIDGTIGFNICCGSRIVKERGDGHIVSFAYNHYIYKNNDGSRNAWDPITVYRACIDDDLFTDVGPGKVFLTKDALTSFVPDENGNFYVVKPNKSFEEISNKLDEILLK